MLTCTIALLLAGTLNLFHQHIKIRKELILSISCYAQIIGENCRAALSFEDAKDASEMLKSLEVKPSIVFACIYTKEGKVLARYQRPDITEDIPAPPCAKESYRFDKHYFKLFKGIKSGNEVVGTVYIQLDTSEVKTRLRLEAGTAILFVLACSLVAYLVSSRLQGVISGPIVDLAEVAKVVSEKKDYSTRAVKQSNDEVGSFIDTFNTMLVQIQQSDSDLREAKGKLEERVAKRTTELTHANEQLSREVDERTKVKQQVQQQNDFLTTVLESMTHPFLVINANDYTIKMANSAAKRLCSDRMSEKMTCHRLSHMWDKPCDATQESCPIVQIRRTGKPIVVEHIHYNENREPKYVEVHAYPILDDEGKLSEIIEYFFDITVRKQAEEKIKVFSDAIAGAFDFFILTDLKGNITYANESVISAFGYTPEEFMKLNINKLDADLEVVKKVMQELAAKGKWSGEVINIRKNGEEFHSLLSASVIKDDEGNPKGTMGILKDITELKNIETALREGEERFRQVVENAGDWIWEVNVEGLYTYASPIVERVLGYKPEEIVGKKHFYDFFAPDVKEDLKKAAFEAFAKRESLKGFVNSNMHKNGSTVIIETSGTPIINEKGNLCGYRGADKDITGRLQKEKELKKVHEELVSASHRAGMAEVAADVLHNVGNVLNSINVSTTLITEKIAKSELANVQKVASIINEHIDEIGTFLTEHSQGKHIPTYLAEVSKCLQAEQTDIIGKLHVLADNVQHIKDIISMQQAYAKVSGVLVQMSPSQLVEDAIQINSTGLQRHGTRLVREFQELPDIEIDKQRVLQIMVNLISNAKYALSDSDKEDKLLTIRINRRGEDRFRIEVADNGAGIPKENLTKIFSHGFTTKQHGHGFGLHSSALAANELGGSLTVHSDGLGKGARFTLELPFKSARVTQ